jgi:hypothetical protein
MELKILLLVTYVADYWIDVEDIIPVTPWHRVLQL